MRYRKKTKMENFQIENFPAFFERFNEFPWVRRLSQVYTAVSGFITSLISCTVIKKVMVGFET